MHLAIKEINRKTDNTVFVKNKDGIYIAKNTEKIKQISEYFAKTFQKSKQQNY